MHGLVMRSSCDDLLEIESLSEERRSRNASCVRARSPKSSSSLRKADCCRAHRGLAANLWRYRLSAGFLERIPGLEIGRFG
jgi:hypothetical protein